MIFRLTFAVFDVESFFVRRVAAGVVTVRVTVFLFIFDKLLIRLSRMMMGIVS